MKQEWAKPDFEFHKAWVFSENISEILILFLLLLLLLFYNKMK